MKRKGKVRADIGELRKCVTKEQMLATLEKYFLFSVPAQDDRGHRAWLRVATSPAMMGMWERLWDKCPKGWFDSKSAFLRALMSLGSHVLILMLEQKGTGLSHIKSKMRMMDEISYYETLDRLKQQHRRLVKDVTESELDNKIELFGLLTDLELQFEHLMQKIKNT